MNKRQSGPALLLLSILILSIAIPGVHPAVGQQGVGSLSGVRGTVNITTTLTPEYTVFDPGVSESVDANVSLTSLNLTAPASITLSNRPDLSIRSITAQAVLRNGSVVQLPVNIVKQTAGVVSTINLPNSTASMTASVTGHDSGESFLGRYVATVPLIALGGATGFITYNYYLVVPSSAKITVAYDFAGNQVPFQTLASSTRGSMTTLKISTGFSTLIIESTWFFPVALGLTFLASISVVIVAVGLLTRRLAIGSSLRKSPSAALSKWGKKMAEGSRALASKSLGLLFGRASDPRRSKQLPAQNLLVLFVFCGVLMVSLGALAGPSPAMKAYVIASPTQTNAIQSQLQSVFGNVQVITPAQDYSDFNVMSSVGMFNIIVVSDYPSAGAQEVSKFVVPNLSNVPVLLIDQKADPTFATQLKALGPDQTFAVADAARLNQSVVQALVSTVNGERVNNIMGLQISSGGFGDILAVEGLLSLILILLGWAYLGSMVSQAVGGLTLSRVATFITSGVFVFLFSEIVYVVTSATLTFPVSLHAVISGAQSITATSQMGVVLHIPLGGGSTPRLAAGIVGVLLGAIVTTESKAFNKKSLILISSIALILLVNPFTFGQYTFEGLLLFLGNITFGTAYASSLTFKGILYGFGSGLGGGASPVYLLSAGKILYFAGLVPLAFIGRMGRTTASVTLLLAAVFVGDGGVRVGEMTPDKTVIAVMPGLIVGFGIGLLLVLLSSAEKWLVANYVRTQP